MPENINREHIPVLTVYDHNDPSSRIIAAMRLDTSEDKNMDAGLDILPGQASLVLEVPIHIWNMEGNSKFQLLARAISQSRVQSEPSQVDWGQIPTDD